MSQPAKLGKSKPALIQLRTSSKALPSHAALSPLSPQTLALHVQPPWELLHPQRCQPPLKQGGQHHGNGVAQVHRRLDAPRGDGARVGAQPQLFLCQAAFLAPKHERGRACGGGARAGGCPAGCAELRAWGACSVKSPICPSHLT